jgi:phenylalanyl-tRNA synthetase beta chain
MKTSYNWLRDYGDFDLPPHELAARMSHAGVAIENCEPHGDDWRLNVEIKSNRPDCLSHMGIAREIAAVTGGRCRRPEIKPLPSAGRPVAGACTVEVSAPDLCPHYTARVVAGVKVGPSPQWLQERLTVCGLRPVNNIVDATNYVMLECGQPLHAFDLARLGGRRIIVRRARPGEAITTIDGDERRLRGEECVIADASRPVALAGVMGGMHSEISDSTTDVLLEAARFDPRSIRRTSRAQQLASDSSYRFERGIDPEITDWASRRACRLIVELAGGALLDGSFDIRADATATPEVTLRLARLKLVLGIDVPRGEVERTLRGLELETVRQDGGSITVRVPSWRGDLRGEIDLIEEVARIYGYDKIGETTQMPVRGLVPSTQEMAERRARHLLAGQGFCEVMNYSLISPTALQLAQPWHRGQPLAVRNPVTVERTHLRLTNMANLLQNKEFNADHGTPQVDLFELGRVHIPRAGEERPAGDERPEEKLVLTLLTDRPDGLRLLKGVLDNLMAELGILAAVEQEPSCAGPFDPQDALLLRIGERLLGCAGVLSVQAAEDVGLDGRPALMEVDFAVLTDLCRLDPPYRAVPAYPATRRDLAVVVSDDVLWADIERCVRAGAPDMLEALELFDVYRGEPVPAGAKSVAFAMTFRRTDRTIKAEEAEEARLSVLRALERTLAAKLR